MNAAGSGTTGRIGRLALHGGGEFRDDGAFLDAVLRAADTGIRQEAEGRVDRPLRIVLLTTAAARHRPGLAFATGAAAFEQVASGAGLDVHLVEARAVDDASAADPMVVARLEAADLIYLPGGDPGVVLDVLVGSEALHAVQRARSRGAVVAGASAGAMAFAGSTWTPDGIRRGFGWLPDLLVLPHASVERVSSAARERRRLMGDERIAILLLDERTGVIEDAAAPDGGGPRTWRVAGAGSAHLLAPHAVEAETFPAGATLRLG